VNLLLTLRRPFVADHFHDLPGFVEARHGHNWEAEACFAVDDPAREGDCALALDAWVRLVDYSLLNGQGPIQGRNPTTELLAQWLFQFLAGRGLAVQRVRMREKANYWAACARAGA
jgi:6-pyruvoyl-tetrahydropterin synthase